MSTMPTGTVTFLFTDIEGSTKRWEQYPQQMKGAFARQEAILRSVVQANGGYAYKMIGDAFQCAFPTALQALQAAIDAQHTLCSEPWPAEVGEVRVRMALHTGVTEVREGDYVDYVGPLLNRAARLLSAGHGGQVLLTRSTFELLRDIVPLEVTLRDMGEHRLKDLARPEHIYQLVAPDLLSDFPPIKTLDNRPNNLPLQPTPFIGREKELADVAALLRNPDMRLVTLTGSGGTGKTRLGLQVGADLLDDFPDGVWLVELAALVEPKLVIPTIAATLGVKEAGGTPLFDTLKEYLKDKKLLLVLDNFEQVIEVAPHVGQLLSSGMGVKVLVTSRSPVRLRGEREYVVPPLSVPDLRHLPTLEKLGQYEAVRLFIERAVSVKADFEVTNDNAPSVAEICVRLDGLPLAIELAAARVKILPPQALLTRLSQRLKVLTGGARDLSARQQTLRGTINWSYDLLDEVEKQLFSRMAVFQGGSTVEALETVCNYDGNLEMDMLEGVESLVSKSLLGQREGSDGEPRFWMLETIHEYTREKLEESGEAQALQMEHALYFMRLAEEGASHFTGMNQQQWLQRLDDEYENLRAALTWAGEQVAGGDSEVAETRLRIAGAVWRFWHVRGMFTEGRELLERALSVPETVLQTCSPGSRVKVLNGIGFLALRQGDYSSARSSSEEALVLGRAAGDKQSMSSSLNNLGIVAYINEDYIKARALHEESLALRRELGHKGGVAISLNNLGLVAQEQGDYTLARALYEESLALRRELGDKLGITLSLSNLGLVAQEQGDYVGARALHEESLALRRELGDKWGVAVSLAGLGVVAVGVGQVARGATLLATVEGLLGNMGIMLDREDRLPYEKAVISARSLLEEEAFERARREGRAMSMEQAIEYALEEPASD